MFKFTDWEEVWEIEMKYILFLYAKFLWQSMVDSELAESE